MFKVEVTIVLFALVLAAAGCEKSGDVTIEPLEPNPTAMAPRAGLEAGHATEGEAGGPALPPGHPPIEGAAAGMMGAGVPAAETDGDPELPLKKTGLNGVEELKRALAAATSDEARKHFEQGFRHAFTVRTERRHYALAESEFRKVIDLDPALAEAYRGLAYAVFNRGLRFDEAVPLYKKAVELKPDYGEAHYALAFILAASDQRTGREHFKRAMELGVPDERQLGPRFYPDLAAPARKGP